jgi:hypothetical protein
MSNDPKASTTLRQLLDGTREQELDCDHLELLALYLDGRIEKAELREQIAHHARQCPECDEELEIVRRVLEPETRAAPVISPRE